MDPKQKLLRTVLNLERYRSLNLQLIEIRLLGAAANALFNDDYHNQSVAFSNGELL